MSKSWCDKLAATPVAGFFVDARAASNASIQDAFAPILDKLFEGDQPLFSIDESPNNNAFVFTTQDGFQTSVEPTRISLSFVHRLKMRPTSGGPPVAELISRAAPYTQLLQNVLKRLVDSTLLLPAAKGRTVRRIGIVAQTGVNEDEAPPGIKRFIDYVGRPWKANPRAYAFNITSELDSTANWADRCIHTITKPEGGDGLVNLSFDWQRIFVEGRPINPGSLSQIAGDAEQAALAYFEELAEGDRFDADDINSKA